MTPAHPPLPTCAYLVFHLSSGSHTSKRMSDSAVGLIVPAIRQNGGRLVIALVDPGGVNEPAVIASTAVMEVFGSGVFAMAVHADVRSLWACTAATTETTMAITAKARFLMTPPVVCKVTTNLVESMFPNQPLCTYGVERNVPRDRLETSRRQGHPPETLSVREGSL